MIIELIGLPGAGKTKQAQTIVESYGFQIIKNTKKNTAHILCKFFFPILIFSLNSICFNGLNGRTIFQIKCFLRNLSKIDAALRDKENNRQIIDEGIFAPINIIIPRKKLDRTVKLMCLNKTINTYIRETRFMFVITDPQKCIDRINSRAQHIPNFFVNLSEDMIKHIYLEMNDKISTECYILKDNIIKYEDLQSKEWLVNENINYKQG